MEQKGRLRTADEWLKVGRQMKDAGVDYVLDRPVYQATLYQLLKQVCENAEDKEQILDE